mmetsp:Transcript_3824/g.10929  ORF Transcript_3824/g.10929 Transcript_3824/m.10929 type:complete len:249 (+) Transcript_3824:1400-2146(+)
MESSSAHRLAYMATKVGCTTAFSNTIVIVPSSTSWLVISGISCPNSLSNFSGVSLFRIPFIFLSTCLLPSSVPAAHAVRPRSDALWILCESSPFSPPFVPAPLSAFLPPPTFLLLPSLCQSPSMPPATFCNSFRCASRWFWSFSSMIISMLPNCSSVGRRVYRSANFIKNSLVYVLISSLFWRGAGGCFASDADFFSSATADASLAFFRATPAPPANAAKALAERPTPPSPPNGRREMLSKEIITTSK